MFVWKGQTSMYDPMPPRPTPPPSPLPEASERGSEVTEEGAVCTIVEQGVRNRDHRMRRHSWLSVVRAAAAIIVLFLASFGALAQDGAMSDNAVIAVAEKMYCPVCENIPLDECQTTACLEWKEEIRQQLAAGRSEAEVIASFVRRFGDQVVGVPQDPLLRWLAIVIPIAAALLATGLGIRTFRRFGRHKRLQLGAENAAPAPGSDADYRRRLEEDLLARR